MVRAAGPDDTGKKALKAIPSTELFGGRRLLTIVHQGEEYRLQITATGKLILTK